MGALTRNGLASKATRGEVKKTECTVTVAMLTDFGLGAVAVQMLNAQGKAPVYYAAEIDITYQDVYMKEHLPKAQALIKASGGRNLAPGGKATVFEAEPPKAHVIIQADSGREFRPGNSGLA